MPPLWDIIHPVTGDLLPEQENPRARDDPRRKSHNGAIMRKYRGEHLPILSPPQVSLIQADVWTGKVLTVDGELKDLSDNDWILVFDSISDADRYAEKRICDSPDKWITVYRSGTSMWRNNTSSVAP